MVSSICVGTFRAMEEPGRVVDLNDAEGLRHRALLLLHEANELVEQAERKRVEASRLRARADRVEDPNAGVRVTKTAMDRARKDGLLAAAAVESESLPVGFTAHHLADALGIHDQDRALRLILALSEAGKVIRSGTGWLACDPDEIRVRDFAVERREFSTGDMIMALELSEDDADYYLKRLCRRDVIEGNGGGFYTYVDRVREVPLPPTRRPPEKDPPAYTDAPVRGVVQRLEDHGKRGKAGAQPGQRHRLKMRDAARERQDAAKRERAERQSKRDRERNTAGKRKR